jgi:hypothetical protein
MDRGSRSGFSHSEVVPVFMVELVFIVELRSRVLSGT